MAEIWKKAKVNAGNLTEEYIYLRADQKTLKGKWHKTKEQKERENINRRIRNLGRIIHANFGKGDSLISLTYSSKAFEKIRQGRSGGVEPAVHIYKNAKKELKLFIKRCQYKCEQEGVVFKCIYITSDRKAYTHRYVRIHHHLIVNREALEIVRRSWKNGHMDCKSLEHQEDYSPIASYLINQVKKHPSCKAYGSTKTVLIPKPKVEELIDPNERLVIPEGAHAIKESYNHIKYTS